MARPVRAMTSRHPRRSVRQSRRRRRRSSRSLPGGRRSQA
jgi:hypothetical protein